MVGCRQSRGLQPVAPLTLWAEAVWGNAAGAASAFSSLFLCRTLRTIFPKAVFSSLMKKKKLLNIAILQDNFLYFSFTLHLL